MQLQLSQIRTDGGTQPRATIDPFKADEYAEDMRNGAKFPPVTVFYDGSDYWLADGFHRIKAVQLAEFGTIEATIKQGTRRDAVLFSVGANSTHGLQRTNDDKRRAVKTLLEDEEWIKWSNREIARRTNTSDPFVMKIREELSITANVSSEPIRTYPTKHGTTATMKISNIGQRPAATTMQPTAAATPSAVLDHPEPTPTPQQEQYAAPKTSLIPDPDPEDEEDKEAEPTQQDFLLENAKALVAKWDTELSLHLNSSQRWIIATDIKALLEKELGL